MRSVNKNSVMSYSDTSSYCVGLIGPVLLLFLFQWGSKIALYGVQKGTTVVFENWVDCAPQTDTWEYLGNIDSCVTTVRFVYINSSQCALISCIWQDSFSIISLSDTQQDVDQRDPRGRTLLHLAVSLGYIESAKVLLQHKADVTKENAQGWTGKDNLENRSCINTFQLQMLYFDCFYIMCFAQKANWN